MNYKILIFLLNISGLIFSINLYAQKKDGQDTRLLTGEYDGGRLYIAVDTTEKIVTGYIQQSEGNLSCQLFFTGKLDSTNKLPISFYLYYISPTVSDSGILMFNDKSITITSSGKGELGPCSGLMSIQKNLGGETFSVTKTFLSNRIALIKNEKQILFNAPGKKSGKNAYLVKGDPVEIIQQVNDWMQISILKSIDKKVWIPASAVF